MMTVATGLLSLVMLAGSALAQDGLVLCDWKKNNVEECKALPGYFKCGVFLEQVPGRSGSTYLESIPDLLRRPEYDSEKASRSAFKNIQEKDYYLGDPAEKCNEKVNALANSRCYLTLFDIGDIFFDNCEISLFSEGEDDTLGNQLCAGLEVRNYVDSATTSLRDVDISFKYSVCQSDWAIVNSKGDPFKVKEKLCCNRDSAGKFKFVRCDGSDFKKTCPPRTTR